MVGAGRSAARAHERGSIASPWRAPAPSARRWRWSRDRAGRSVTLWARDPEQAEAIRAAGENAAYLPGVPLPPALR